MLLIDALIACRSLELFGTFFPFNEKIPVGEMHVVTRMAVILHPYIVEVIQLETILTYKLFAQQMALPIQTQSLEFIYQLSKMFHNRLVSLKNYFIAFGGVCKI